MPQICDETTETLEETVWDPVQNWVNEQRQACTNRPWPFSWLCWFFWVLVLVVTWVARIIITIVVTVVCYTVSVVLGFILSPLWVAIDAVFGTNVNGWMDDNFGVKPKCKLDSKSASASQPGAFDYSFICVCNGEEHVIQTTASNDSEAKETVKKECEDM